MGNCAFISFGMGNFLYECKGDVTSTMLMGCAVAETTGLYALVIAILLIFVAPGRFVDLLMTTIGG